MKNKDLCNPKDWHPEDWLVVWEENEHLYFIHSPNFDDNSNSWNNLDKEFILRGWNPSSDGIYDLSDYSYENYKCEADIINKFLRKHNVTIEDNILRDGAPSLKILARLSAEDSDISVLDEDLNPLFADTVSKPVKTSLDKDLEPLHINSRQTQNDSNKKGNMSILEASKNAIISSAKTMGFAGLTGIKLAGAKKVNEAAYAKLAPLISNCGVDPNDPAVKASIMMMLPLILHPLATLCEGHVSYVSHIKPILELSFTDTIRENGVSLIEFATDLFRAMYLADKPGDFRIDVNYNKYETNVLKKAAKERGLRIGNIPREEIISMLQETDMEHEHAQVLTKTV